MKKGVLIAIGLFVAVFVTGHFFIFQLSQASHQQQFRSFIKQNLQELEKIEISPSELYTNSKNIYWLDDNKEVKIANQIYDIVSIKNNGKTVSLFVINDKTEKNLMDKYNELAGSIYNSSYPDKPNLIKDFLSLKYLNNTPLKFTIEVQSLFNYFTIESNSIVNVFLPIESPPPTTFIV